MPTQEDPALLEAGSDSSATMGFFDHLLELRRRLINCLIGVAVCCIVGFVFWREIYTFLSIPILDAFQVVGLEQRLIFTGPLVPIRIALKVGLYTGIFLSAPVIFWQL